jgi:hypothetical protein
MFANQCRDRSGFTFQAWKLFSYILPKQASTVPLGLYVFHRDIDVRIGDDLSVYTGPLNSPSVDFIARLVIDKARTFKVNDLLTLADMANLGVLILLDRYQNQETGQDDNAGSSVSDRLVRGWSEKERPFPNLRLLEIAAASSITMHSLQYVSKFPSLTYCHFCSDYFVQNGGVDTGKRAESLGWRYHDSRPFLGSRIPLWINGGHGSLSTTSFLPTVTLSPHTTLRQPSKLVRDGVETWHHAPGPRSVNGYLERDGISLARLDRWNDYLASGTMIDNIDITQQGVPVSYRASLPLLGRGTPHESYVQGDLLLPPRPMASVQINTPGLFTRRHDQWDGTQVWFVREYASQNKGGVVKQADDETSGKRKAPTMRQRPGKRQNLGDLLSY